MSDIALKSRHAAAPTPLRRLRDWVGNPWGRPRFLVLVTWLYILVSIAPVIIAIQFSFNSGRSVTAWQGFSLSRWYWSDPVDSVWHDPTLQQALVQPEHPVADVRPHAGGRGQVVRRHPDL